MFTKSSKPRLAIVHDALINTGGAERVVTYMHETFPDAPIITSAYLPNNTYPEFRSALVRRLAGSRFVHDERRGKQLLPWWLIAFTFLNLDDFDVVLTSSTWGAKFIQPSHHVCHISYCYAPFRLLWKPEMYSASSLPLGSILSRALILIRGPLKRIDLKAMQSPRRIATTCDNMAREIAACYQRQAQVIYAPIRLSDYQVVTDPSDYYLCVSRLISYKRIDLAVEACRLVGRKLVVVGEGPERTLLETARSGNVSFLGRVCEPDLKKLYSACRAVIFPSYEDYGLVPLEAQACGRPVIAYRAGGTLETVIEGQTGIFFDVQTVDAVVDAIQRFETLHWDSLAIRRSVQKYDVSNFKQQLREYVLA